MKRHLDNEGEIILKPLEVNILKLVVGGKSNKEIANELYYSKNYIDNILSNCDDTRGIYFKIGVKNRAEATYWFVEHYDEDGNVRMDFDVIKPNLEEGSSEIKTFDVRSLPKLLDNKEIINQVKAATFSATCMRNAGYSKQAIKLINFWIKVSEDRIKGELDSTKVVREINYELMRALVERMACYSKILDRDKIVEPMLKDHTKGLLLAISLNDNKSRGVMHSEMAAAYYIAGEWEKAIELEYKALPFTENIPALRTEILRGLMLEYAHLDQPDDFLRIERMALKDINHGIFTTPMDISPIFDGSGRGRAILEKPNVENRLDAAEKESKKIFEQMKTKPLRSVQNFCSRLIAFKIYKEQGLSIDVKYAAEIAYRGHCLAKYFGYGRHVRDIEQMQRYLNIPPFENPNIDLQLHLDFLS